MSNMTNRVAASILVLLFCSTLAAVESTQHSEGDAITAHQWDVIDIHFAASEVENPLNVTFAATFTHATGGSNRVTGFYNGGSDYIIRFTPPSSGTWNYVTVSPIAELSGLTGKLNVEPAGKGRRGGVVLDPENDRRFRYQNGDGYYPIAFECDWLFALDAENQTDIPVTRTLVDQLADSGFNQVVMNVFAYDVTWDKDPNLPPAFEFGSPKAFPFAGSNKNPDHTTLNIEYFRRLDRVIEYLDRKGIVAHLMIYVWNKRANWPKTDSDEDNMYFDYVARRYQAFPNIVWDISKEALGYGHNDVNYITGRIKRLRKQDAFNRLITVHDYGYCRRFSQQVDFVSVQLWQSELYSVMRNVWETIPSKPILNIEHGGYECSPYTVFNGNYTSPEVCLQRAYLCVFAGTFPTHYWQGAAWNVVIPDVNALPEEDRPRLEYYRHMRDFVDRYHIGQLAAGKNYSNAGFCLQNGRDLFIYYIPKECDFLGLRLKQFNGRSMKQTWFNPLTGEYSDHKTKKITRWPTVKVPDTENFHILIVQIEDGVNHEGPSRSISPTCAGQAG